MHFTLKVILCFSKLNFSTQNFMLIELKSIFLMPSIVFHFIRRFSHMLWWSFTLHNIVNELMVSEWKWISSWMRMGEWMGRWIMWVTKLYGFFSISSTFSQLIGNVLSFWQQMLQKKNFYFLVKSRCGEEKGLKNDKNVFRWDKKRRKIVFELIKFKHFNWI